MICNRSIEGANKNITMNSICDRIDIGYAIYDMDPETGEMEVWSTIFVKSFVSNEIFVGSGCVSSWTIYHGK